MRYYRTGGNYRGIFLDGQKYGQGTQQFANGDKYIGPWCCDEMVGYGNLVKENGDRYQGHFKDGKYEGTGSY